LALGRPQDFLALAVAREYGQDAAQRTVWALPLLRRWPPGTPFPAVIADVAQVTGRLDRPVLVIDATGVGRGVLELFRQAELPVSELVTVTVTGGHQAHRPGPDCWAAPRKDLVAALQSVLQGQRLRIARGLADAAALTRQLAEFRARAMAVDEDDLAAWRDGGQEDLVVALALAVWQGEFGPPPEYHPVVLCYKPPPGPAPRPPPPRVVFPEVRYFGPHDSFQPMPRVDGRVLTACPDFSTQAQAAYFIVALRRALGLPPPDFCVELPPDEQKAVDEKVQEVLRQRRLGPAAHP
jgi:hypothetical protein